MANTIVKRTIRDGRNHFCVECHILGDGSGQQSDEVLVDVSALSRAPSSIAIHKIYGNLDAFSVDLEWDATADTHCYTLSEGESGIDFNQISGPMTSNAGDGKTGDLLFTTRNLASGYKGFIRVEGKKKF